MKLIKGIRLHRKLRKRQEYLCYMVCKWSEITAGMLHPQFNEYCAVNKAVRKINNMLPNIYFVISDLLMIFLGIGSLRYVPPKFPPKYKHKKLLHFDLVTFDLRSQGGFNDAHLK